jgi:hypothetical protein
MEFYINFICNALLGGNPQAVDSFYATNESAIMRGAKLMQDKYPPKDYVYFRGILLEPKHLNGDLLKPLTHIKYLSFTEDETIANDFGDVKSEMSLFVMQQYPKSKGYLIEHKANLDEILFHHSWIDMLGLDMYFNAESMQVIKQQKEVILKQRLHPFKVKPL